jgi:hypothetical protein
MEGAGGQGYHQRKHQNADQCPARRRLPSHRQPCRALSHPSPNQANYTAAQDERTKLATARTAREQARSAKNEPQKTLKTSHMDC